jgi:glycosyltransferase involved in cell wall biosynthesis
VHHGVDPAPLPFCEAGGEELVCFGRVHPDKGTHEAITIARAAGRRLALCGPVQDERYFNERVAPHVDGEAVRYLGSVEPDRRAILLGEAACLLHPIAFEEPFGLSVVEAMICGTPVVAYPRGSMPEIVEDGVTGAIADGVAEAVVAVERVAAFDRAACRRAALRRFDVRRMVDSYLHVYEDVLRGQ